MLAAAGLLAHIYVYDPQKMLQDSSITALNQIRHSQASIGQLYSNLLGIETQGLYDFGSMNADYYKCAVFTTKKDCDPSRYQCDVSKMINISAQKQGGTLSGGRRGHLTNYSASNGCTKDNTAVILSTKGRMDVEQTYITQIIFIVLLSVVVLAVVCIIFVSMDEEQPDDRDDCMNPLLFNAPEMVLAPEALLDDEPWESGGDDY